MDYTEIKSKETLITTLDILISLADRSFYDMSRKIPDLNIYFKVQDRLMAEED